MKQVWKFNLNELCGKEKQIILETQEGVELSILVENGVTLVLLPFGNKTVTPKKYGHLSSGIVVLPLNNLNRI
jgi:hypothetical protein